MVEGTSGEFLGIILSVGGLKGLFRPVRMRYVPYGDTSIQKYSKRRFIGMRFSPINK